MRILLIFNTKEIYYINFFCLSCHLCHWCCIISLDLSLYLYIWFFHSNLQVLLEIFAENKYVSITYDCELSDKHFVKHFGDVSEWTTTIHQCPRQKIKWNQFPRYVHLSKMPQRLLWKYFAININALYSYRKIYNVCEFRKEKDRDTKKHNPSLSIYFAVRLDMK